MKKIYLPHDPRVKNRVTILGWEFEQFDSEFTDNPDEAHAALFMFWEESLYVGWEAAVWTIRKKERRPAVCVVPENLQQQLKQTLEENCLPLVVWHTPVDSMIAEVAKVLNLTRRRQ